MVDSREKELLEALIDCRECLDRVESFMDRIGAHRMSGGDGNELLEEVRKVLDKTSPLISVPEQIEGSEDTVVDGRVIIDSFLNGLRVNKHGMLSLLRSNDRGTLIKLKEALK